MFDSVDEGSTFDALQTLADLSLMMPETTVDTGKKDIKGEKIKKQRYHRIMFHRK